MIRRVAVIAILFVASALFWAGYEQAGSSLNLFAKEYTVLAIKWLNVELPAGWFQSVPAFFVIAFAPVVAHAWVLLNRRGVNVSLPAKIQHSCWRWDSSWWRLAPSAR